MSEASTSTSKVDYWIQIGFVDRWNEYLCQYTKRPAYSLGGISQPWKTRLEASEESRIAGRRPVFPHPPKA